MLIAQKLGKDKVKFAQLKDGLGGDHPAFINEDQQTINGQSIDAYNKQNASNSSAGLGDMDQDGRGRSCDVAGRKSAALSFRGWSEGRQARSQELKRRPGQALLAGF